MARLSRKIWRRESPDYKLYYNKVVKTIVVGKTARCGFESHDPPAKKIIKIYINPAKLVDFIYIKSTFWYKEE